MTNTYESRDDVITREILPALGEYAAEYDVEAIADAVIASEATAGGVEFWVNADVEDFWNAVCVAAK